MCNPQHTNKITPNEQKQYKIDTFSNKMIFENNKTLTTRPENNSVFICFYCY